jgi:hypothetical protein
MGFIKSLAKIEYGGEGNILAANQVTHSSRARQGCRLLRH